MKSELFTVFGVVVLGLSHGISQAYLSSSQTGTSRILNVWLPVITNFLLTIFLLWGITMSKMSQSRTLLIIAILTLLSFFEVYYMLFKPDNWVFLGQIVLFVSSIFKLYVLVTLHCDVTSSKSSDFFTKFLNKLQQKSTSEPREREREPREREPREREPREVQEYDPAKATGLFNDALRKSPLSSEEKEEVKEKFLSSMQDDNPWNNSWNIFNNSVVQKIREDVMTKDEKDDIRNKFRIAMGKTPKVGGRR